MYKANTLKSKIRRKNKANETKLCLQFLVFIK